MTDDMMSGGTTGGTVKWFSDSKGYGFIEVSGRPKDIFVHYSDIHSEGFKTLAEGTSVQFELEPGRNGDRARNVSASSVAPQAHAQAGGF